MARSTGLRTQWAKLIPNKCFVIVHPHCSATWSPHNRQWDVCPAEHGWTLLDREVGSGARVRMLQSACANTELRAASRCIRPEQYRSSSSIYGTEAIVTGIITVTNDLEKVTQARKGFFSLLEVLGYCPWWWGLTASEWLLL